MNFKFSVLFFSVSTSVSRSFSVSQFTFYFSLSLSLFLSFSLSLSLSFSLSFSLSLFLSLSFFLSLSTYMPLCILVSLSLRVCLSQDFHVCGSLSAPTPHPRVYVTLLSMIGAVLLSIPFQRPADHVQLRGPRQRRDWWQGELQVEVRLSGMNVIRPL